MLHLSLNASLIVLFELHDDIFILVSIAGVGDTDDSDRYRPTGDDQPGKVSNVISQSTTEKD